MAKGLPISIELAEYIAHAAKDDESFVALTFYESGRATIEHMRFDDAASRVADEMTGMTGMTHVVLLHRVRMG